VKHASAATAPKQPCHQRLSTATGLRTASTFGERVARNPLLVLLVLVPVDVRVVMITKQYRPLIPWPIVPVSLLHRSVDDLRTFARSGDGVGDVIAAAAA
jgi:hypothetical protein